MKILWRGFLAEVFYFSLCGKVGVRSWNLAESYRCIDFDGVEG